jgi:DeoR/GlpR family transcriptional regulator of sugar metabolism
MEQPQAGRRLRSLERQHFIMQYLKQHKRVDVSFLSAELNVSEVTIRKDLEKLEREKQLLRSHGGALLNEHLFLEPSFTEKKDVFAEQKAAIAAEAAKLIQDGMTVALSTGTTVNLLARLVKESSLTVVTNAMNVASDLMQSERIHLYLTGGHIRPNTFAMIGETAERALDGIYVDYAFIGTNGFSLEQGLTTPSMEEARVVRGLIAHAKHVVAMIDSSKFDKVAFYRIVPVQQIHTLITDSGAPEAELAALREMGIHVIVVEK